MLPRTLNGKKCEVPVKRILAGAPDAAISRDALADPAGFDAFLQVVRQTSPDWDPTGAPRTDGDDARSGRIARRESCRVPPLP